jgi:hypothetical protein
MQNISNIKEGAKNLPKDEFGNIENNIEVVEGKKELAYLDVRQGFGEDRVKCGSEVEIEYILTNKNNGDIINKSRMNFDVGSGFNKIIERALIGMNLGAERIVDIPKNFKTGDNIYDDMIQNSNMVYKISLIKLGKEIKVGMVCDE